MGISTEQETKPAKGEAPEAKIEVPAWLNAELYAKILAKELKNFKSIQSFRVEPAVGGGENFLTVLLRVNIKAALSDGTTTEVSYVSKILPPPGPFQQVIKASKVFEKEHNTYNNYLPEFEAMFKAAGKDVCFGPKVVQSDAPKDNDLLVLEDLRVRGFANMKRQDGLDLAHTEAALEKLAQFHAASACRFAAKGPYPVIYNQCLCHTTDLHAELRKAVSKLIVACLPLYKAEHLTEKIKTYAANTPNALQRPTVIDENEFNVLNHGDMWSNNVMFTHDAQGNIKETYFVDFQMSRQGSPAHDLLYFLMMSTCLENKLKLFDHFIAFYWEKLIENLKLLKYTKPLPKLRDLHIALFKYGYWSYAAAFVVMPMALVDPKENCSGGSFSAEGEKGDELKKAMYTNARYVEHIRQVLPWMYRRGVLEI